MEYGTIIGLVLVLAISTRLSLSEVVDFGSGLEFTVVVPSSVSNQEDYADPKNTGSVLLDSNAAGAPKRLSLNVLVDHFRSITSNYFRAHPTFVDCVQKVMTDMQNQDKQVMIVSGFKPQSAVKDSTKTQDLYARSGCGVELRVRPDKTGTSEDIAASALRHCPVIFERVQRDLGIIMLKDSVHIHMTGPDDQSPLFDVDGYSGKTSAQFKTWALEQIDEGLEPFATSPDCSKFSGVDSNGVIPSGVTSPEDVVGHVDEPITRDEVEDFKKLVQYLGRNMEFENAERTATWCSQEGSTCLDCQDTYVGNSLSNRCMSRMMSVRMYNVLRKLQKLARDKLNSKLKVLKAWEEPYEGYTPDSSSLHTEGRAVTLELVTGNSAANLKVLTQLARCAKADYIEHKGTHMYLAVKKMKSLTTQPVKFPIPNLIPVSPPSMKKPQYKLPSAFTEKDEDLYPLFDSSEQGDVTLANETNLELFVSKDPDCRYFRLNPRIAECYSELDDRLNKWNKPGDKPTTLKVQTGFMCTPEQMAKVDVADPRYNTFNLGMAMEISFGDNPNAHPLHYLAKLAVDKCAPLFDDDDQKLGLGLFGDRVYVGMRSDIKVWLGRKGKLPVDVATETEYAQNIKDRVTVAIENRVVDPDDVEEACSNADVPHRQSPTFKHTHSPRVQRRRRAAPDPDDCVPEKGTSFCSATTKHRQAQVEKIWGEVKRKWLYHDEKELRSALEGCYKECGTCLEGDVFDDKSENCNNFLHWAPFSLGNDEEITNLFPRDKYDMRKYACDKEHCLEDAPLFHLVAYTAEATYRPDETKSVSEELYSQAGNPTPMIELLYKLYGIHASGRVKLWVEDEADMTSMQNVLQVVMLYNKNVTELVVYVANPASRENVEGILQNFVLEWSTGGCPKYTREFIPAFSVQGLPKSIHKRSKNLHVRDEIINHYNSWESRWAIVDL